MVELYQIWSSRHLSGHNIMPLLVNACGLDEGTRGLWKNAPGNVRRYYRDEIIGICRIPGASLAEVDLLTRYEVRQMLQRTRGETLRIPDSSP